MRFLGTGAYGPDAFETRFDFTLVPWEHFGQPNEERWVVRTSVVVTVAGGAFGQNGNPENDEERKWKLLFWYALEALERGENRDHIEEAVAVRGVDARRIRYPAPGVFDVEIRSARAIGFRG